MDNIKKIFFLLWCVLFLSGCSKENFVLIAHRGASLDAVEHTFEAYDIAIENGGTNIEQDIVVSGEGTLYVSHDRSAKRITGTDKAFIEMSDSEINELETQNGEHILTLESVFKRYGNEVTYVVELRDIGEQIKPFVSLVNKYGLEKNIILQSFSFQILENADEVFPEMTKMLLFQNGNANVEEYLKSDIVDIICLAKADFSKKVLNQVHDNKKELFLYTVNDIQEINIFKEMGVDGLFTDDIVNAIEIFE